MEIRILLTDEDFTRLTKGEILKKGDVQIALQDIGYLRMMETIAEHIKSDNLKNDNG